MGGSGETRKVNTISLDLGGKLGGSCILTASAHVGPLATKWEDWQVLQMDTSIPSTPQLGLQRQWGAQRLGAWRSLVPGGPRAQQ